jgi:tetratricopeptide (TPR) repeat protein
MSYTNTTEEDFIPINFRFGLGFKYFVDDRNSVALFFDINKLLFPFGEAWTEVVVTWTKLATQQPAFLARRAGAVAEGGRDSGAFYKDENDEMVQRIRNAGNEHCVEERSLTQAYAALREARYKQAIDLFEKAANEEKDNLKKSTILLTISKIYYAHLKNFPAARKYALDASKARPNWGEPFLLIGRLYASSGPLCGPGRGWDSQVVVWPAIDMWNRAKSVDPSTTKEANEYINRYMQYMPTNEDLFQRLLKEGDTFRVGCWIQENTTVRAAPRN